MARNKKDKPGRGRGKGKKKADTEDEPEEVEIEDDEEEEDEPAKKKQRTPTKHSPKTKNVGGEQTLVQFLQGKPQKLRTFCQHAMHFNILNPTGKKILCSFVKKDKDEIAWFFKYGIGPSLGFSPSSIGDVDTYLNSIADISGLGPRCPMWKLITKCMGDNQRSKYAIICAVFEAQQKMLENSNHEPTLTKNNPTGRALEALIRAFLTPTTPSLLSVYFSNSNDLRTEEVTTILSFHVPRVSIHPSVF
jgi:hypothetical protein